MIRAGREMAAWLSLVFLSLPASPGSAEQRILALAPHIVETLYAVGGYGASHDQEASIMAEQALY